MRMIVLSSLLLLTAACATVPTNDFDVAVVQNEHEGVVLPNDVVAGLDVDDAIGLDVTVSNRTAAQWKVEGVAIGAVPTLLHHMPRRTTRWDEALGPGETKTFHRHWPAQARVGYGKRDIPIRVELYLVAPDGTRRTESFIR